MHITYPQLISAQNKLNIIKNNNRQDLLQILVNLTIFLSFHFPTDCISGHTLNVTNIKLLYENLIEK